MNGMEQNLLNRIEFYLNDTGNGSHRSRIRALFLIRSLIVNPSTSEENLQRIVDFLTELIRHDRDQILSYHSIKLLSDLAFHRKNFSGTVLDAIKTFFCHYRDKDYADFDDRLFSIALSSVSIISTPFNVLNQELILLFVSSPTAPVRAWFLDLLSSYLNASENHIESWSSVIPSCSFERLLLGLTKDPYPSVRRAAMDCLVVLSKTGLTEECYVRSVELLLDYDWTVRLSAMRVVGEWGCGCIDDMENNERIDAVFIQLCSMARDMIMEIRVQAFIAIGKMKNVSLNVLLNSLSKKVKANNERTVLGEARNLRIATSVSSVAGAFIHGVEDEFYEVRLAACKALGNLSAFSVQFSEGALDLLMDVLNDDTFIVRLETLQAMRDMASHGHLKVQEKHMHMFLGVLVDANGSVRNAAREILRLMKFPDLETFISAIHGLLLNLESYPKDENDVFSILFYLGKSHEDFAISYSKKFSQEVMSSGEGDLGLDKPKVAVLSILVTAATLSHEHLVSNIPPELFSYAITMLERISCYVGGTRNQDFLLAHLLYSCRHPYMLFTRDEEAEDQINTVTKCAVNNNFPGKICTSLSESYFSMNMQPILFTSPNAPSSNEDTLCFVKDILRAVGNMWPLIQLGCVDQADKSLRSYLRDLSAISICSHEIAAILAFSSQYVKVIQLLTKIWKYLQTSQSHLTGLCSLDLLLDEYERNLRIMRYAFPGLSKEEELHILELILLGCVLRLLKGDVCFSPLISRLSSVMVRVNVLCKEGLYDLSDFTKEVNKSICVPRTEEASYMILYEKLLKLFSLQAFSFQGRFKHMKVQIFVPINNSENPIPFSPGLPVGITFCMSLYNVPKGQRLWLHMNFERSVQYAYLEEENFDEMDDIRKCTITLPFYRTPRATFFSLMVSVGIECPFEDFNHHSENHGGPRHKVLYLCEGYEVFLASRSSI